MELGGQSQIQGNSAVLWRPVQVPRAAAVMSVTIIGFVTDELLYII
jgi:hypothetical protein